ncbi:MAG TPA: hypothetical protein VGP27_26130 [Mycobacterium sp.]|nr:hypothetical protein [Mycobacterium sp.]
MGSNRVEFRDQPPAVDLSRETRTQDAVLVGALCPTMRVWFTNARTTAGLSVADASAGGGTVATAETCFYCAPGTTVPRVNDL